MVSNVDSQASIDGAIFIQVLGEISNDGQESRKFAQSFGLAPQEKGFYVQNDIFRFLKEDVDSESGDDQHYDHAIKDSSASFHNEATEKDDAQKWNKGSATQADALYDKKQPAHEKSTLFSHNVSAEQAAQSSTQPKSVVQDIHLNGQSSETVSVIEKAAAGPAHAAENLAQEVVLSPPQTPVSDEQSVPKPTEQISEAVEAIAAEPKTEVKHPEVAKPSIPMSWAARAAQSAAASKASAPAPAKAAPAKPVAVKPAPVAESERRAQSSGGAAQADVTRSAFLKNVSPKMTDEAIRSALKKFGEFKNVEINRSRLCGFVDYLEPSSCAAAIKTGRLTIDGETFSVEERRRDVNGRIGPKEKKSDNRGGDATRGARNGTARGGKNGRTASTQPAK